MITAHDHIAAAVRTQQRRSVVDWSLDLSIVTPPLTAPTSPTPPSGKTRPRLR